MNVYYVNTDTGTPRLISLSVSKIPNDAYGRYKTLELAHGYPAGSIVSLGSWCVTKKEAIQKALLRNVKDFNAYIEALARSRKTIQAIKKL